MNLVVLSLDPLNGRNKKGSEADTTKETEDKRNGKRMNGGRSSPRGRGRESKKEEEEERKA